jgi:hypothetical protein
MEEGEDQVRCVSGPRRREISRHTTLRQFLATLELKHALTSFFSNDSHKSFAYQLPDGNTAETAFAWVPKGSVDALNTYLNLNTSNIPSHISLGVSLWLANDAPDVYVSKIRPAIDLPVNRFPEAQISIRTSATTVQAIVGPFLPFLPGTT